MKFWDRNLRICAKCKRTLEMTTEEKAACPHCQTPVWFFQYAPISEPPRVPEPTSTKLFDHPATTLLLVAAGTMGLAALSAIGNGVIIAVVCTLAAIGFSAFGFLRHKEAMEAEDAHRHAAELQEYADTLRVRLEDASRRYLVLYLTGNERIDYYYKTIYEEAEREKTRASELQRKAERDRKAVVTVEDRIYKMAERFVSDHRKWSTQKLRPDPENYQLRKSDLSKAFNFVESVGYELPSQIKHEALQKLKNDYSAKVREYTLKEEQKKIRQQMREEERLRKEREEALLEAEREEARLQQMLDEALRVHQDAHDAEVEYLHQMLAEARAKSQKALSMAQLTKTGHVYILSNVGAFGNNVYKVGMTRRLEPDDRVKELSGASVPFPFDVHAMISCEDAPALEAKLHRELTRYRMNRVNLRKEYFEVEIEQIIAAVEKHHGTIEYLADPQALEYWDSQGIDPETLIETQEELVAMGITTEDLEE